MARLTPTITPVNIATNTDDTSSVNVVSTAFNAPANSMIVVGVGFNSANAATRTVTLTNSGAALTWNVINVRNRGDAGSQNGFAGLWYALVPTARTGMTVTATGNTSADRRAAIRPFVITNFDPTDPIGAIAEGSSTSNAFNTTGYTSEVENSAGFVVANDWIPLAGVPTSSNTTITNGTYYLPPNIDGLIGYRTPNVAAGSSITFNVDGFGSSAAAWNWVSCEVRGALAEQDKAGSDALTIAINEGTVGKEIAKTSNADAITVSVSDTAVRVPKYLTPSDTVTVSITESSALNKVIPKAAADTLTVSITESSALGKFIPKAVSDTLTVSIASAGLVGSPVDKGPGNDAINIFVSEGLTASKPIDKGPVGDNVTVSLTDNATPLVIAKQKTASDTITVGVTDTGLRDFKIKAIQPSDSVFISIGDSGSRLTTVKQIALADAVNVTLDAMAVNRLDKVAADTINVSLTGNTVRNTVGPVFGTRVSPAMALPEEKIAGSQVLWRSTVPGAATLTVETSVDNGATWQAVENGGTIPRLLSGTTTARSVMTRVTMTRVQPEDPTPRLHRMEVRVFTNGSQNELCPLGVFTLNDVVVDDTPAGLEIELSGADLSRRVSRNRWDKTYVIEAGTNYSNAIQNMITDRLPGTVFNFASTPRVTPRLFFGEQSSNDPWQDAQDMATSIGMELFFDARGVCTLRPEPNPEIDESVWEFEDRSRPTMTQLTRRVTDENTYNKVVVTGEGSGNDVPVRAVAIDDDPASPTYYLGPYGTVVLRITNSLVLTTEQAQDAADAALLRVKGATEAIELSAVPMPALEPGDVVTVTRDRSKVEGRFIIDSLTMPLGAEETMRAVSRRQRI